MLVQQVESIVVPICLTNERIEYCRTYSCAEIQFFTNMLSNMLVNKLVHIGRQVGSTSWYKMLINKLVQHVNEELNLECWTMECWANMLVQHVSTIGSTIG